MVIFPSQNDLPTLCAAKLKPIHISLIKSFMTQAKYSSHKIESVTPKAWLNRKSLKFSPHCSPFFTTTKRRHLIGLSNPLWLVFPSSRDINHANSLSIIRKEEQEGKKDDKEAKRISYMHRHRPLLAAHSSKSTWPQLGSGWPNSRGGAEGSPDHPAGTYELCMRRGEAATFYPDWTRPTDSTRMTTNDDDAIVSFQSLYIKCARRA